MTPHGAGRAQGTGLNDFQRRRADALAELGYAALAFDLHCGRWFTEPEAMLARVTPLLADLDRMRCIGRAALDVLRAESRTDPERIAAIGYGTGGLVGEVVVTAPVDQARVRTEERPNVAHGDRSRYVVPISSTDRRTVKQRDKKHVDGTVEISKAEAQLAKLDTPKRGIRVQVDADISRAEMQIAKSPSAAGTHSADRGRVYRGS